jgi:amidase
MDAADLAFAGAARQVELVRSREVSARELTQVYLDRIDRLDPQLNAYRVVFAERALAEADQADARAQAGDARPLLGVPIAIKDDCDVAGEVTARGGSAYDGAAPADAEVVRRLRTAGAVVLGKTHVPELTITPWTESPTFGVTRNPWDLQRTPGGSSGGSGAAVAAGLASAGIASDGAGSIRIPAACCGLFGFKPQNGRVPTAPQREPWRGMTTWGPISRHVADSALIDGAIRDGGAVPVPDVGRLRIAVSVKTPPLTGVEADAEQRSGVQAVAEALRELGHEVVERELEYPADLGLRVLSRYLRGIADEARSVPHPERLSRRTRGYRRLGGSIPEAFVERARAAAADDEATLGRVFEGGVDLLLTPVFTRRPPVVGEYEGRPALWCFVGSVRFVPFCGAFNHTGQPAASVPATWTSDGFPVGAQLVAPRDGDPLLLAVSAQLERALGWPDRRPELGR